MISVLFTLTLFVWTTVARNSLGKNTSSCTGVPNTLAVITEEPTLITEVTNGKLYQVDGDGVLSPPLSIAHMWGTPYEMGFAYGQLLKDQVVVLLNETMVYMESEIEKYLPFLEPAMREKIAEDGINGALDYVYDLAYEFIPQRYIEEMQGLADATGVSYQEVARMAMIPEAIKASCTMG